MTVPKLKDTFSSDISTFLNPDEFAGIHTIDGREMHAVITEATENQHPMSYADGVSLARKVVYLDSTELGYKPREGGYMNINGRPFFVTGVSDEEGIYVLTMEANVD